MKSTKPIALLLLFLSPLAASALESDKNQPIYIEADSVEIDDGKGVSTFEGNVDVTQGSLRFMADKVIVTRAEGKSDHIHATGNPVTFEQELEGEKEPIRGMARVVEYDTNSEMVHMIGDSVLYQGKDSFKSDRITYDRTKSLVRAGASAKGKQRVRISIESKKTLEKAE